MKNITAVVVSSFTPPGVDVNLVVFSGEKRPYIEEKLKELVLTEAKRYAKHYGVYLIPELYEEDGTLHCCILSPAGEILGISENGFLNLNYRGKLHRGKGVKTIDTPIGKISLVVDVDVGYPQTARLVQKEKGELIVALSYMDRADFYPEMVTYKGMALAVDSGVPVLWVTSCGVTVLSPKGETASPFSWLLPYEAEIELSTTDVDKNNLKRCKALLSHTFGREEEKYVFL